MSYGRPPGSVTNVIVAVPVPPIPALKNGKSFRCDDEDAWRLPLAVKGNVTSNVPVADVGMTKVPDARTEPSKYALGIVVEPIVSDPEPHESPPHCASKALDPVGRCERWVVETVPAETEPVAGDEERLRVPGVVAVRPASNLQRVSECRPTRDERHIVTPPTKSLRTNPPMFARCGLQSA